MKLSLKDQGKGAKIAAIAGLAALLAGIGYLIYGIAFSQYQDAAIVICLLIAGAALCFYSVSKDKLSEYLPLLGVMLIGYAFAMIVILTYNVWQDVYGNFNMYGKLSGDYNFFNSQGGPVPAIILYVLTLVAMIMGAIACFKERKAA